MTDIEKKSHIDFLKTIILEDSKELAEKTRTEIWSVLSPEEEKELIDFVIDVIKKLNPDAEILSNGGILFSDTPGKLKLPKWFYFSDINWITNKNVKRSWVFVSINVYPLRYHPNFN